MSDDTTNRSMAKKVLKKKKPAKKAAPSKLPHTLAEQVSEAGLVMEACGNDEKVAAFFLLWLQNGRDASQAYLAAINPNVTKHSAETLGSRMLSRVERATLAKAYGLGYDEYFKQLKAGLKATRLQSINFETHEVEDHKTRRDYHKALGEIIGVEKKEAVGGTAIQVNVGKAVQDWIVTE